MNLDNCELCAKNVLHEHFYQKEVTFYKHKSFDDLLKEHLEDYKWLRKYEPGKCAKRSKRRLAEEAKEIFDRDRKENVGKIVCRLLTIDGRKIKTEEIEGFIKFIL